MWRGFLAALCVELYKIPRSGSGNEWPFCYLFKIRLVIKVGILHRFIKLQRAETVQPYIAVGTILCNNSRLFYLRVIAVHEFSKTIKVSFIPSLVKIPAD